MPGFDKGGLGDTRGEADASYRLLMAERSGGFGITLAEAGRRPASASSSARPPHPGG